MLITLVIFLIGFVVGFVAGAWLMAEDINF